MITEANPASQRKRKPAPYSASIDRAAQYEKCCIGSLLENPALCSQVAPLASGDFFSGYCRETFIAITKIVSKGGTADIGSVIAELGESVPVEHLTEWRNTAIPESFAQYKRAVLQAAKDRQYHGHLDSLTTISERQERITKLREMTELLESSGEETDWRTIFHSKEEFATSVPLEFRINGFLQDAGITLIGGLSDHGKTLIMLSMVRSLLEGTDLFGYGDFNVSEKSSRVLYLVPELSKGPFFARLKLFRLGEYFGEQLFVYTLNSPQITLSDTRLLEAVKGADVFLDTAVRFMEGSENDAENSRIFADNLFRLLKAGARSITGAHHSPKSMSKDDYLTLENVLRGSGDLGAMISTAWGVRQIDTTVNRIWVQNVKHRDFEACEPFILEGRPYIDTAGSFWMSNPPGTAGELKQYIERAGRPVMANKEKQISECLQLHQEGKSLRDIARQLKLGKSTVQDWIKQNGNGNAAIGEANGHV